MHGEARIEASRWLAQAEDDLVTATRLAKLSIHYACRFFAQQAAEKALKALFFARGAFAVRGHSVADLCAGLAEHDPDLEPLVAELAPLDLYYIPKRYPSGLVGSIPSRVFSEDDSARALRLARRALETTRKGLDLSG
jgi:HEPN domain-containing protein